METKTMEEDTSVLPTEIDVLCAGDTLITRATYAFDALLRITMKDIQSP